MKFKINVSNASIYYNVQKGLQIDDFTEKETKFYEKKIIEIVDYNYKLLCEIGKETLEQRRAFRFKYMPNSIPITDDNGAIWLDFADFKKIIWGKDLTQKFVVHHVYKEHTYRILITCTVVFIDND